MNFRKISKQKLNSDFQEYLHWIRFFFLRWETPFSGKYLYTDNLIPQSLQINHFSSNSYHTLNNSTLCDTTEQSKTQTISQLTFLVTPVGLSSQLGLEHSPTAAGVGVQEILCHLAEQEKKLFLSNISFLAQGVSPAIAIPNTTCSVR